MKETAAFYQKKKQAPILGRESFIARKTITIAENKEQPESRRRNKRHHSGYDFRRCCSGFSDRTGGDFSHTARSRPGKHRTQCGPLCVTQDSRAATYQQLLSILAWVIMVVCRVLTVGSKCEWLMINTC